MNEQDKIKDKIKKLLALQRSAEDIGSLEEAQNAMGQIRKLVIKYKIDMASIEAEINKPKIGYITLSVHDILPFNKTHGQWLSSLYHIIAKYNFGKSVTRNQINPNHCVIDLWGEEYTVEIIKDLSFNYATQIISLEKRRWKEVEHLVDDKRNSFRRAYYNGSVVGLASTFIKQEEELQKEHGDQVNALMRTNELAIKEEVQKEYETMKNRKSSNKSKTGASMGFADGKNLEARRSLDNKRLIE